MNGQVESMQFALLIIGLLFGLIAPVILAIIWKIKKKEKFSSIFTGALFFILFAIILEKPIQNALILTNNPLSAVLSTNPVFWALVVGLFPGVFEETGRLVAFKTILKKRQNKETAISYGIGHGGIELIFVMGLGYITNILYAVMINSGAFMTLVNQVQMTNPSQLNQLAQIASQLMSFSVYDLGLGVIERVFAFLFHVGASILVFYACKGGKKLLLYPLAIILHTGLDFFAGLYMVGVLKVPAIALEAIVGVIGILTFTIAYICLYKKDVSMVGVYDEYKENEEAMDVESVEPEDEIEPTDTLEAKENEDTFVPLEREEENEETLEPLEREEENEETLEPLEITEEKE